MVLKGLIYDESKINGYNPVNNPRIKSYPVPLKIWHCMDDDTVSFSVTENYADTIKSNGGNVELVVFENGGHEPQLVGPEVEHPCGITDKPVTPAVDGVLDFENIYSVCKELGVENILVEQDNAHEFGDALEQMQRSYDHLRPIVK